MGRPPTEIEDKLCKSINIKLTIDDYCNLIDRAEKVQDYGDDPDEIAFRERMQQQQKKTHGRRV